MPHASAESTIAVSVFDLIRDKIKNQPQATAVSAKDGILTYSDLDHASSKIAALLWKRGVRSGDIVPILAERRIHLVPYVLAVIRLGACWVPMEASTWSPERIKYVLSRVSHKVVLSTTDDHDDGFADVIPLQQVREAITNIEPTEQDCYEGPQSSEDIAYIIFTSGTTGLPKGVEIEHQSLLHYVQQGDVNGPFNLGVSPSDTVLLLFSVAFDAFYGVLFSTICNGGKLVLSEPSSVIDDAEQCTILPCTPTLLSALPDPVAYTNIRAIFLGGESSSPELIRKWWTPCRRLWNTYGPTEATVAATIAELRPELPVTLGTPIKDCSIFILDNSMEEASEGEICIAGPNLARGYYKDKERTADMFIQWKCKRIYRTGDLARKTKAGLVFCGRKDQMVKNRGFLINLEAEVVPALLAQPNVVSAVAIMHHQKLVAFVTPSDLDSQLILRTIADKYDQFLVPDEMVLMEQLPQTTNGKTDIKALKGILEAREQGSNKQELSTPEKDIIRQTVAGAIGVPAQFVDLEQSFTEVGGNSLLAIKLLSSLRKKGVFISFQSLFLLPKLSDIVDLLHVVSEEQMKQTPNEQQGFCPMTDVQKAIVRSTISNPPAGYMVISISLHLSTAGLSASQLSDAWRSVIESHSVFRASFDTVNGLLEIGPEYRHRWQVVAADEQNIKDTILRESSALLDLARGEVPGVIFQPITEFRLVMGQGNDSVLLWLVHHSLIDGHSIGTIVQDVRHKLMGESLIEKTQFPSYSRALQTHLEKVRQAARCFWTEAMTELQDGTQLSIYQTDWQPSEGLGEESLQLGLSVSQVDAAARSVQASPAVIMYSAWALLLCNYVGKNQVVFGGVFSGRNLSVANIEQIVGPLINTCPLPIRIPATGKKIDLLRHVQTLLLGITEYQWSTSELLPEIASGSQAKILDTVVFLEFDLDGFGSQSQDTLPAWTYHRTDFPEFGLTLQVQDVGRQLVFRALYDKSRYGPTMVSRMLHHFRNLCIGLMHPATETISQVYDHMLEPDEFLRLISGSSSLHDPYFGPSNLRDALELGVQQWPNAIATESPERTLTYAQLDRLASHFARSITALCSPNSVVALLGDGSLNWLVGALAICKASAVYLPLDTKLPIDRMKNMVETSGASLCLYPNKMCFDNFSSIDTPQLLLHELASTISDEDHPATTLPPTPQSDDYAYIMFTSGSTGTPKGIKVTHRAVLSHLSYAPARMHARPGRRHAQIFSPGFDVNIAEIYGTLCYGATLVLKDVCDPFAHLYRVNATMITPSFLSILSPEGLQNLDTIYLIGEAVPQSLSDRWSPGRTLYNFYGPCECTIAALYTQLQPGRSVTLGRPVPRVGVYILDKHNRPVPVGVTGEICLSGVQVMEGYIGEGTQAITKRVFGTDPFNHKNRMYRTGDVGVWTESGEVRFIGRVDNQVKVRGYRIELEEIEQAIQSANAAVGQCAAIVSQETIYAFVAPDTADLDQIHDAIRHKLPSYAHPQRILALPSLPTTPNQKLDRKTLATLIEIEPRKKSQLSSKSEQLIDLIWRDTLGLAESSSLSPDDDFLELGGNSLGQITAAQKLCAKLGFKIPLSIFIRNTELRTLAKVIDSYCQQQATVVPRLSFLQYLEIGEVRNTELSYLEKELYKMHNESSTPSSFNLAHEIQLSGPLNLDLLERAIHVVVSHHTILQVNYELKGGCLRRTKHNDTFSITRCQGAAGGIVNEQINKPFDLATDQLSRIVFIEKGDNCMTMLLVQHHIITDQVASRILLKQIAQAYVGLSSGVEPDDNHETASYASWAQWKNSETLNSPADESALFWKSQFSILPPSPFQWDGAQVSLQHAMHSDPFTISIPPSCQSSLELFLAATVIAFRRVLGCRDLSVGIPFIDRTEPGTDDIMGIFLDRLPVPFQIDDTSTANIGRLIPLVQSGVKSAIAHALPYFQIREITGLSSLFDVMFVYNRREDRITRDFHIPFVTPTVTPRRAYGAKFPLLVEFTDTDRGIVCELEYFEELISSEAIGKICDDIQKVLESSSG